MDMKLLCCVMFKNEEEVLKRCLDSVADIVDGYLLVDTGSTDSSLEIASSYEKAYIKEIEFENFVITKNRVLDFAEKMPYTHILWMDADEYIRPEEIENFKKMYKIFKQMKAPIAVTSIHDFHNSTSGAIYERPRIWINNPNIRFDGPGVHEFIPYDDLNSVIFKHIEVYHSHKIKGKNQQESLKKYIQILLKYEINHPTNLRCLFYIARSYIDMRDWEKAIEYTKKYRKQSEKDSHIIREEYWYSLLDEARALKMLHRLDESVEIFERAINFLDHRAEAYYELAVMYFYNMKDPWKAIEVLEKAQDLPFPSSDFLFVEKLTYPHKILDLLGILYSEVLNFTYAIKTYERLIDLPDFNQYCVDDRILNNLNNFKRNASVKTQRYNINDYFDEIYLINLERRKDRLLKADKKLKDFGISYKRMKAYDGQLLKEFVDPDILVRRTPGYLGCLLSHLEAIKISYDKGLDKILILEDDIIIHRRINEEFERIINTMELENNLDWDLLYLGGGQCTGTFTIPETYIDTSPINDEMRPSRIWKADHVWSGHAYALNRKMMKWILDYYQENGYKYELDRVLASEVQRNKNFKCLSVYPQLIMQHDTISDNDPTGNHMTNYVEKFLNKAYSIPEYYN